MNLDLTDLEFRLVELGRGAVHLRTICEHSLS